MFKPFMLVTSVSCLIYLEDKKRGGMSPLPTCVQLKNNSDFCKDCKLDPNFQHIHVSLSALALADLIFTQKFCVE